MNPSSYNRWLHRFAVLTALATLALIAIGGLVTSHEAGMSVPDWPNSYGYNMFLFPPSKWIGGILYEHTHRLWASMVGLLVVALTRWLGGRPSRRPLAIVGALEMLAGLIILFLFPKVRDLQATGGFFAGIGGIVLLAGLVWVRNEAAPRPLPQLGWLALVLVQIQGLLGGLRVVMFKDQIGIFHGTLAQLFFVLTCAIALLTSKWWMSATENSSRTAAVPGRSKVPTPSPAGDQAPAISTSLRPRTGAVQNGGSAQTQPAFKLRKAFLFATFLILFQLMLGATMRHQHAGLSIPDFPLAYGKLWPATDPASVVRYNAHRVEITAVNPITAFQIDLQMVHRLAALLILAAVGFSAWRARRSTLARSSAFWLGLILLQACLGAATVLSNKAADIATAHVLVGAISLATGAVLSIIVFRFPQLAAEAASKAPALANSPAVNLKGAAGVDPAGNMSAAR